MVPVNSVKNKNKIRKFATGATRDTDDNKPDYFGFFSPLSMKKYGEYMNAHRKQADGSLRDSSNWKLGIPAIEYVKSLDRHVMDVKLHFEGFPHEAREDCTTALCAILFNAQGLLYELNKTPEPEITVSV